MGDNYTEWEYFSHPDPDEEDLPALDEIQILREFADRYGATDPVSADDTARKLMSLVNEKRVVVERQSNLVDKGERVSYLL
ncbi:hypothetical protein N7520_002256 [Penicillium odoratum]|uniref:uncharacterized protein n=1 Tax=Penicillium odoratum TaxID=1167516 RepID=UPI002546E34B|nr:uncharacterized protein N7520_002256 [Penicillium odoratum]KAJ5771727.1 hypothetical protein N7520_002256 [Penicillium odoratum]